MFKLRDFSGCKVTPEAYGIFTQWLSSLANGRVILCLEGGYNVNSIAYSMTMCTKALLADPMPAIQVSSRYNGVMQSCWETLRNVVSVQKKYWKSLKFDKRLPDFERTPVDILEVNFDQLNITPCDADDNSKSKGNSSPDAQSNSASAGPSTSRPSPDGSVRTLTDFLCENAQVCGRKG
jgi:histone deacetylase 6